MDRSTRSAARDLSAVFMLWGVMTGGLYAAPPAPSLRDRGQIQAVLARVPSADIGPAQRTLRIALIADKKDHAEHEHDYPLWQKRWALLLGGPRASTEQQLNLYGPPACRREDHVGAPNVEVLCVQSWPEDEVLRSVDVLVAFCYLKWNDDSRGRVKDYLSRGGGLVLLHSATWTMPGPSGQVADLVGIGGFTRYRHGRVDLELSDTGHPICLGLPQRIQFLDETYWPPTPAIDPARVTVLATCAERPGQSDPPVPAPQPIFWTYEPGRGRVFGCVLGHYTWTFDDPWFRVLVLRGLAWAAGESVYRFDSLVLRGARVTGE